MTRRPPRRRARQLATPFAILGAACLASLASAHPPPAAPIPAPIPAPGQELVSSQEAGQEPHEGDEAEELKKAEAWPEVDGAAVKAEVERLRKARTEEMGLEARAALIAFGPGAAPFLIDKLPHERDDEALARMRGVLDQVTDSRHTRLLGERFDDKAAEVRLWSLKRAALFPDPGLRAAAEKALQSAQGRKRKLDPAEVYAAALCCAAAGSFAGFEQLATAAEKDWGELRDELGTALGALRGAEATARVAPLLEESSRKRKLTGLRLLAACGEKKTAVPLVRPFLDDTDNSLRVGAINALRGIVDGDPPLKKLPVFEAIERASKWKARL